MFILLKCSLLELSTPKYRTKQTFHITCAVISNKVNCFLCFGYHRNIVTIDKTVIIDRLLPQTYLPQTDCYHIQTYHRYIVTLEKLLPWTHCYHRQTYHRQTYHRYTITIDRLLPWTDLPWTDCYHGQTFAVDRLLPWTDCCHRQTVTIDIVLP